MSTEPRELPSGKWQGIARHPSGRRATKTFALKRQAAKWAADTEAEWRRVGFRDPRAGRVTMTEWHARYRAGRIAERTTLAREEQVWRLHVEPAWASWPLDTITRMEVQSWAARMLAADVGVRTVHQAVGLLSALVQAALDEDPPLLAGRNPCRGVAAALPPATQRPPTWYTVEQVEAILRQLGEPYRTLVDFACTTGLRFGELAGLQSQHLDLPRQIVHVHSVLERDGTLREYPKSRMSRRAVPVPPHLAERMRTLEAAGGHVFRRPDGEPLEYYRTRSAWERAIAAAGVPAYSWHATRHTAASWLVQAGVDLYRVQAILGHESHVTTRRYAHLAPDAHDVVIEVWKSLRARSAHEGMEPSASVVRLRE